MGRIRTTVLRIVANLNRRTRSARAHETLLGLDVVMDHGWIITWRRDQQRSLSSASPTKAARATRCLIFRSGRQCRRRPCRRGPQVSPFSIRSPMSPGACAGLRTRSAGKVVNILGHLAVRRAQAAFLAPWGSNLRKTSPLAAMSFSSGVGRKCARKTVTFRTAQPSLAPMPSIERAAGIGSKPKPRMEPTSACADLSRSPSSCAASSAIVTKPLLQYLDVDLVRPLLRVNSFRPVQSDFLAGFAG